MFNLRRLRNVSFLVVTLLIAFNLPVQATDPGAGLRGSVIYWGNRTEPGMTVNLNGGGWMVDTVTDAVGNYVFQNLGSGGGVINPVLAKGGTLKPMTTDLAVPIGGPGDLLVNLGIYGGEEYPTGLPVSIRVAAEPIVVKPGEVVTMTVTITNNTTNSLHQVYITDLFPTDLTPMEIGSTAGTPWIGGKFAAAAIGLMEPGKVQTLTIAAQLNPNMSPEKIITNKASVFYAESAATQAEVKINDVTVTNHLPETGGGYALPMAAFALVAVIWGVRRVRLGRAI